MAIRAGMPIRETMEPLSRPMAVATIREIRIATHMFRPMLTIMKAQITLTRVMMEPMDRSMPAIRMTKVMPMEAIP